MARKVLAPIAVQRKPAAWPLGSTHRPGPPMRANGAVEWNRTTDPVLTKDVLCP